MSPQFGGFAAAAKAAEIRQAQRDVEKTMPDTPIDILLGEDGQRAREIAGPVTWLEDGKLWSLGARNAEYRAWRKQCDDTWFGWDSDHEAACLWAERMRVWLKERKVYVHPRARAGDYAVKRNYKGSILVLGETGWISQGVPRRFATYLAALVAAVLAVDDAREGE